MTTWVKWGRGVAHAAPVQPQDVRVGSFPLACGRWAPDGWDATVEVAYGGRRCARCVAATERAAVAAGRENG